MSRLLGTPRNQNLSSFGTLKGCWMEPRAAEPRVPPAVMPGALPEASPSTGAVPGSGTGTQDTQVL